MAQKTPHNFNKNTCLNPQKLKLKSQLKKIYKNPFLKPAKKIKKKKKK